MNNYKKEPEMSNQDAVQHPKHYTSHPSGIECIQVTEHMGFNLGNATKYIWRADLKGDALEDLRKAEWYVRREIEKRSGGATPQKADAVIVSEATYDEFKAIFERDRSARDMAIAEAVREACSLRTGRDWTFTGLKLANVIAKVGAAQ